MSTKKTPPPEMMAIRTAALRLAAAHQSLVARAKTQEAEIAQAIAPIAARHLVGMEEIAAERAAAHTELLALVEKSPALFVKPRSLTLDGIRTGYRKEEDALDWADEAAVIARIEALFPDLAATLVRTQTSLVVDALSQLEPAQLRALGVRQISGADKAFVTIGDSDVDKLVKAIIGDMQRRIGEDEAPKRKGKAKVKEAA